MSYSYIWQNLSNFETSRALVEEWAWAGTRQLQQIALFRPPLLRERISSKPLQFSKGKRRATGIKRSSPPLRCRGHSRRWISILQSRARLRLKSVIPAGDNCDPNLKSESGLTFSSIADGFVDFYDRFVDSAIADGLFLEFF